MGAVEMHGVALIGAAGAMALGLISGAVLKPAEGELRTGPSGPQLIYTEARDYRAQPEAVGWWSAGAGQPGEWVYGTDWSGPQSAAEFVYQDDISVWRPEPQSDRAGEHGQIGVIDDQRRGQIDDLAHRPDPRAELSETLTEGPALDRVVELYDPDRAKYAHVDDAR